jgi:transposase
VTLQEIQAQVKARFELTVPVSVLDRFIRKRGWRYQKNAAHQRAGA